MRGSVATLIGPEAGDVVAAVARGLAERGASVGAPDWLAPGMACDVPFTGLVRGEAETALREAVGGAPVDVVVQSAERRRKRLLVADMESTIIENEMLDE